jgi:predicted metal-binding membrane protein
MGSRSRWLSAGVLAAAGLYQLSPLQGVCLSHCRSPAAFLSRYWRPGPLGAVRLGVLHGTYCLGCCWLLMALLFVGGVMNLAWIAALTLLVLAEKLLPGGPWVARAAGVALLAWGAATLLV